MKFSIDLWIIYSHKTYFINKMVFQKNQTKPNQNKTLWASTSVFARPWHSLTTDSYIRVLSAKSCYFMQWCQQFCSTALEILVCPPSPLPLPIFLSHLLKGILMQEGRDLYDEDIQFRIWCPQVSLTLCVMSGSGTFYLFPFATGGSFSNAG